jgi:DNA repair protein RadA/Sms
MAKLQQRYVCQECGSWFNKWAGRCEQCQAWNSIVEEVVNPKEIKRQASVDAAAFFQTLESESPDDLNMQQRTLTAVSEFDRVCGGGLVPGSVILLGGDPGIGKSTLLLQVVAKLSQTAPCAYISGEEALSQLRLRAQRLGVHQAHVHMAANHNVLDMMAALTQLKNLKLVIVDSIQTLTHDSIDSPAGSVSQVRACAHALIELAKTQGFAVVLVGHVTKEGTLAGPRVLEHMVDTVLYFEGDRNYDYRILRSVKNRFGATDEIGVFSMTDVGLQEVTNPSHLFLNLHDQPVSGTAVFAGMEGTRPLLVEIQALVAPSYFPAPRRTAVGWDTNRLSMIVAVLEARCKMNFGNKDIYLNVAGGLKISEPAADLAVAAALVSALKNTPLPSKSVYFGEIGLTGDVRPVNKTGLRMAEAQRLGFEKAFCAALPDQKPTVKGIECETLKYLLEAVP